MQVEGSVVLVTGGASGLGAATARRAAQRGARVVIADVQEAAGTQLAAELNGRFARCDVTQEADGLAAVELAVSTYGALHALVCCAGVALGERTLGRDGPHDLARFTRVVTVNLVGTFNMVRLAAAAMAKGAPNALGERGVIVTTASAAAYDGQMGQVAYAASKSGVVGMTLPLARDLARHGIRVVSVAPGLFLTPMLEGLPEEARASLAGQVPFPPRLGDPDAYARLALHIVENEMLNGETVRLDGALRMAPK